MSSLIPPTPHLDRLLSKGDGFLVVTSQPNDPPDQKYEVWAYRGPLDFAFAEPVCYGVRPDIDSALLALDYQLDDSPARS